MKTKEKYFTKIKIKIHNSVMTEKEWLQILQDEKIILHSLVLNELKTFKSIF